MARHPINVALLLLTIALVEVVGLRRSTGDGDSSSSGDFMDQYIAKSNGDSGTGSVWWKQDSGPRMSKGMHEAVAGLSDFGGFGGDVAREAPPSSTDSSTASGAVVDVRLDSELQEAKSLVQARKQGKDSRWDAASDSDGDSSEPGDYMDSYIANTNKGVGSVWWKKAGQSEAPSHSFFAPTPRQHFEMDTSSQESTNDAAQGAVVDVKLDSELQLARSRTADLPDESDGGSADFMDEYLAKANKGGTGSVWWKKEARAEPRDDYASMMRHRDGVRLDRFNAGAAAFREEKPAPSGAVVDVRLDSELQEFLQSRS